MQAQATQKLQLTKFMISTIGQLAPALTSKYAEKIFMTPRRFQPSERELKLFEGSHEFTFRYGGQELSAWSWGDAGPTVFLVHGWSGRAGQMTGFVAPLLKAGYSVVAFDAPGHGRSQGQTSSVVEFAGALAALVDWTGPAHAVIGHSMGGAAVALALERDLLKTERVIFLGTPSSIAGYSREFAERFGVPAAVQAELVRRVERRFGIKFSQLDITRRAIERETPLLVFHDEDDKEVNVLNGEKIASLWPSAQLIRTRGLGHVRILRDPEVHRQAVAFIKSINGAPKKENEK